MINISVPLLTLFHLKLIRPKSRRPAGENYVHIVDIVYVHVIQINFDVPDTSGKLRLRRKKKYWTAASALVHRS